MLFRWIRFVARTYRTICMKVIDVSHRRFAVSVGITRRQKRASFDFAAARIPNANESAARTTFRVRYLSRCVKIISTYIYIYKVLYSFLPVYDIIL